MKYIVKKENLPQSKVKLIVTVEKNDVATQISKTKKRVLAEADLKGFRKGHVPEGEFIKAYGAGVFVQETAYDVAEATYMKVLVDEKIKAVGRPTLNIVSAKEGEDVVYELIMDVMPTLTTPDYKTLYKDFPEKEISAVTEEEIDRAIEDIKSYRTKKGEKGEDIVPEMNEEFIKTLGIESGKMEDLREKLKENFELEKQSHAKEVRKNEIVKKLIDGAIGDIPESFIENELLKLRQKVEGDLSQMGVVFADYLKHLKKTEQEWKESEKINAERSARLQIALLQISEKENIKPSKDSLDKEVAHLKMHYKDLDESRARSYSEEVMTNTMVMEYLLTGRMPNEEELFKIDHKH